MEDNKLEGIVKEVIYNSDNTRAGYYRVEIETHKKFLIQCHEDGYIRYKKIVINEGDKVKIQLNPMNLSRGRVLDVIK